MYHLYIYLDKQKDNTPALQVCHTVSFLLSSKRLFVLLWKKEWMMLLQHSAFDHNSFQLKRGYNFHIHIAKLLASHESSMRV